MCRAWDANTLQDFVSNTSSLSFGPDLDKVMSLSNGMDSIAQGLLAKIISATKYWILCARC